MCVRRRRRSARLGGVDLHVEVKLTRALRPFDDSAQRALSPHNALVFWKFLIVAAILQSRHEDAVTITP